MADDGLFSNLRFSDIFFPAVASIASAYNPYIGRGLQTGMNLFNTMSGFQNSLRYWQEQKKQREAFDRQNEDLKQALEGYDSFFVDRQNAMENTASGQIRSEFDEREVPKIGATMTPGGPMGMPLFDPQAISAREQRFSDIYPDQESLRQAAVSRLADDREYQNLAEQRAGLKVLQAGVPVAGPSVMSTFGTGLTQRQGHNLKMASYQALQNLYDEQYQQAIDKAEHKNRLWQEGTEATSQIHEESRTRGREEWLAMASQLDDLYANNDPSGLKSKDLWALYARYQQMADEAELLFGENSPQQRRYQTKADILAKIWTSRSNGSGGAGGGTDSDGIGFTPQEKEQGDAFVSSFFN